MRVVLCAYVSVCGLVAALFLPGVAGGDIGIQGPAYAAGTGGSPTTSRPESKLWFHDGFWWASMAVQVSPGNSDYHILKLVGSTWTDTTLLIDERDSTRQDVLSVGNTLFVASHKFQETTTFSGATGNEMRLYRFTYNGAGYQLDAGFPVSIDSQRSEALVIDRAADDKLWATWVQQNGPSGAHLVYYSHTTGNCSTAATCAWTPRAQVPGSSAVSADDISALVRFGDEIGVMWSDQTAGDEGMKFAHVNTALTWSLVEVATPPGPKQADDHINMKADGNTVYVATKTKFISKTALNPQTRLLVRNAAGTWTAHTISYSPERRTRPIVVLDTDNDVIHVFETGPHPSGAEPETGGDIFESTSRLSPISFAVLSRRPVIQDDDSPGMNNATSTKQNLNSTTDLAVVATNVLTKRYWHHFEALTAPPPRSGSCTITGTPDPDILNGTPGPDVLCGLGGNDIIRGFGGNDRLYGGGGNDRLYGGRRADRLNGGLGNDVLVGGFGLDTLRGASGRDRLVGGPARDVFLAGPGNDRLYGGGGADRLNGGLGNDVLVGGFGLDTLRGASGRDRLVGGPARDVFLAGPGNDTLITRDGRREWVAGGTGRDRARVDSKDIRRSIEALF